jgi:hypothetical protein
MDYVQNNPKQADTQLRPEECSELLPLVQHLLAGILSTQSSVRAGGERGDE